MQIDGAASLGQRGVSALGPDSKSTALSTVFTELSKPEVLKYRAGLDIGTIDARRSLRALRAANAAHCMQKRLDEVLALQAKVVDRIRHPNATKFEKRGQLLPRERVARLIGSWNAEFLELSPLAGLGMHDDDGKKNVQGGGSIVGIGVVAGKRVMISASDSAIKGGTIAPMGLKKALRAHRALALENKLPLIALGGKWRRQFDVPG